MVYFVIEPGAKWVLDIKTDFENVVITDKLNSGIERANQLVRR